MAQDSYALAVSQSLWVGNMFPRGGSQSEIVNVKSFDVYVQTYKKGVTDRPGQGGNMTCNLIWSEVDGAGNWKNPMVTRMSYNGKIGNNDQYKVTISPPPGRYEFTANCTDMSGSTTVWQQDGNGRLTVNADRSALWVEEAIIAWNGYRAASYELHYDLDGNLTIPPQSGAGIALSFDGQVWHGNYAKFPNISGYDKWRIPAASLSLVREILQGQVAIAAYDGSGKLVNATGIQMQGVLDDLYSYSGDLGVLYSDGVPTLKLWAPTAQAVTLHRFADANPATTSIESPMTLDSPTGVWTITGDRSWDKQYYLLEVKVYVPSTGKIESNIVTDPYAVSLSQNSQRSQFVDLYNDRTLKPAGWDSHRKPLFTVPEDMAVYEVHVRDFSRDDQTVAPEHRGKFKAFTYDGQNGRPLSSDGMKHLIALAQAGLSHIHLLPAFDITTVNEDPAVRIDPDYSTLAQYDRNSDQQQAIVGQTRDQDSFNWGYDPYHYGVPEGSYATDANGTSRIGEFREMVQTLNQNGLRVVMDVVYNHTNASGQDDKSVLDKVVPGYYYRCSCQGHVLETSCTPCADTAAEFDMMQKLMIDTLVTWAKAYKVDAFRFDLMNFHTVENIQAIDNALKGLTLANDGVDGQTIYLYGEGWEFGSAKDKGLHYASQFNMAGTGIGTFNDKIRDAVHGGYNQDPTQIRYQGFINGLSYDWNGYYYGFQGDRSIGSLRYSMDRIRVGLAGSLQDFQFVDQNNNLIKGIDLNGTGYARDPQETVNYVSKHDNETLYDLNVFKMPPGTSMAERVRAQNLALDIIGLAQGIPFFHMGSDMLRSKSLDRNSYNSGDWFNRVDFTYQKNNFGSGLPPAADNERRWEIMKPLLANAALDPSPQDIMDNVQHMLEILQIRKSSKLFRLETAADIKSRVQFHNTGSSQKPAMIVMSIRDDVGADLDPNNEYIVVLFNGHKIQQNFTMPKVRSLPLSLHPVQQNSHDPVVKTASFNSSNGEFTIPPQTTAVFVSTQAPAN
ncbi:MAG: pullulanase-type alpha-1,6-glucosidase [Hormoscilla sp. GUM202]|nr:pullulanase-type alpha-1,6-glucosidase [Hormoscilla sp. GUM202]